MSAYKHGGEIERERLREKLREIERERERKGGRERLRFTGYLRGSVRVRVCMCERKRGKQCVCVCFSKRNVCECVRVCEL